MGKDRKLFSVSEYCAKNGIEKFRFFEELKKHPKFEARLKTDSKGEYVADIDTLGFIADTLNSKKLKKHNRAGDKKTVVAVATEMNILAADNERLRAEVKSLKQENSRLRDILESRIIHRRSKIENGDFEKK